MSRSPALTLLALAIAVQLGGTALAQDHVGHHGAASAQSSEVDAPAAHAKPTQSKRTSREATDARVGHTSAAGHDAHAGHGQSPPQDDHAQHSAQAAQQRAHATPSDHAHHSPSGLAPTTPIPVVTEADRVAAFPDLHKHMEHAPEFNGYVALNRLEAWEADSGHGQAWEASAWLGTDLNRLWLRTEGERVAGHTEAADLEVLYGHSVSAWWDVVGGVRHETRPGPSRSWAALGVQGLAPYKFEVQATAYLGNGGRVEANVEAEYEVLLTNRLILQPLVELDFAAKDDEERGIGRGLSKAEAGLRLRYEFTRKFAPYIGVVHERTFGSTADRREAEDEHARDTRFVVGLRTWF